MRNPKKHTGMVVLVALVSWATWTVAAEQIPDRLLQVFSIPGGEIGEGADPVGELLWDGGEAEFEMGSNEWEQAKLQAAREAVDLAEAAGTREIERSLEDHQRMHTQQALQEKDRRRDEAVSEPLDHVPGGER